MKRFRTVFLESVSLVYRVSFTYLGYKYSGETTVKDVQGTYKATNKIALGNVVYNFAKENGLKQAVVLDFLNNNPENYKINLIKHRD